MSKVKVHVGFYINWPEDQQAQADLWFKLQSAVLDALRPFEVGGADFKNDGTPNVISDQKLEEAEREARTFLQINEVLKGVAPEKRLDVLRCASILSLGKDLDELGGR